MKCFVCNKVYSSLQQLENHLLIAKKKCYIVSNLGPPDFNQHCSKFNRALCIPCNKFYSCSRRHICSSSQIACDIQVLPSTCTPPPVDASQVISAFDFVEPTGFIEPFMSLSYPISSIDYNTPPASVDLPPQAVPDPIIDPIDPLQVLNVCLSSDASCLNQVPNSKNCRRVVADAFINIVNSINRNPTNLVNHVKLFLFPLFVLGKKKDLKLKQAILCKQRARLLKTATLGEMMNAILLETAHNVLKLVNTHSEKLCVLRAKKLISLGRLSDAIKALDSSGIHVCDEKVLSILRDKHPQLENIPSFSKSPGRMYFQTEDVVLALNSFANGSSGGPSRLTIQVLLDFASVGQLRDALLDSLAGFASHFASCDFPDVMALYYGGGRLIPLSKKDGGVRPLAVGETLRRLVCKMALSKSSSRIKEYFPPMQLGVGIPNGAEAIIHSMAFAIENLKPDESALQVDFSNAFNLIDRSAFLSIVKEAFPDLSNLVGYLYSAQGRLLAGV